MILHNSSKKSNTLSCTDCEIDDIAMQYKQKPKYIYKKY